MVTCLCGHFEWCDRCRPSINVTKVIPMKEPQQYICCPPEWISVYEQYMKEHKIKYTKYKPKPGGPNFKISRKYRPHAWKLEKYLQEENK